MRAIWLPDVIFIKQRLQRLENSTLYIRRTPNVTYAEEQLKWSAWLRTTAVSTPWAKRGTLDCRIFCVMRPRPAVNGLSRCDSNFMQSVQWRRRENRESGNIVNVNVMPAAVTCVIDREGKGCCDRDCLWSKRSGSQGAPDSGVQWWRV